MPTSLPSADLHLHIAQQMSKPAKADDRVHHVESGTDVR